MDNVPVLEEKSKIKMPMKELGRQKPQNNMKCDCKKKKWKYTQSKSIAEAKAKIMKKDIHWIME